MYAKQKHSAAPGRRAREVDAAAKGESYSYVVDKFLLVKAVRDDGQVVLMTRRGKEYSVDADDPNLRRASLWQLWWHRHRYSEMRRSLAALEKVEV